MNSFFIRTIKNGITFVSILSKRVIFSITLYSYFKIKNINIYCSCIDVYSKLSDTCFKVRFQRYITISAICVIIFRVQKQVNHNI